MVTFPLSTHSLGDVCVSGTMEGKKKKRKNLVIPRSCEEWKGKRSFGGRDFWCEEKTEGVVDKCWRV